MTRLSLLAFAPLLVACSANDGQSASGALGAAGGGPSGTFTDQFAGSPGSGSCVPQAPQTFAEAVCVCRDLAQAGTLATHASAQGAAGVGVNQSFSAATGTDIEGGLIAFGGLAVAGDLSVRDSVLSPRDVSGAGSLHVGGDLSVGGTLSFAGSLSVGGTLRAANPPVTAPGLSSSGLKTGAYAAPGGPPCGCDPASILPVAKAVAAAAATNDNAARGLTANGADMLGQGTLTLTSGKYYFKDATRVGQGKIVVNGAVALYFDGSIDSVGDQRIELATGASLDMYVSGIIASAGSVVLGDPAHPEAFRLFVGGAGSMMATAGDQTWNGLVYAPQADIAFAGVTAVRGAVFARSLSWAGRLDVTYDGMASASSSCTSTSPPGGALPR